MQAIINSGIKPKARIFCERDTIDLEDMHVYRTGTIVGKLNGLRAHRVSVPFYMEHIEPEDYYDEFTCSCTLTAPEGFAFVPFGESKLLVCLADIED